MAHIAWLSRNKYAATAYPNNNTDNANDAHLRTDSVDLDSEFLSWANGS